MMMYKTDLIRKVANETRLSQRIVAEVLGTSLEEVQAALAKGEKVNLLGFGTFYTRLHPAGTVRHIRTGEAVEVPESTRVGFRVGELLKKAVASPKPRRRGRAVAFWHKAA